MEYCRRGHPRVGKNIYIAPKSGSRSCQACKTMLNQVYQAEHKAYFAKAQHNHRERKRAQGICLYGGCRQKADLDMDCCTQHRAEMARRTRQYWIDHPRGKSSTEQPCKSN